MMKFAAVIQNASDRQQRRAGKYADNFHPLCDRHSDGNGNDEAGVDRHSTEQRHRLQVHFARAWLIHKACVQGKLPHRPRQSKRCRQGNCERDRAAQYHKTSKINQRAVSIVSKRSLTCAGLRSAKYQSMVRRKPSRNMTSGSQSRSCFAKALSATRFAGPVGIFRKNLKSAFLPAYSRASWAASITRTRSIVPRFTAVPS